MINFAQKTARETIARNSATARERLPRPARARRPDAQSAVSTAALAKALDMVSDAVFLLDERWQIVAANAAAARASGYRRATLRHMPFDKLVAGVDDVSLPSRPDDVLPAAVSQQGYAARLRAKHGDSQAVRVRFDLAHQSGELHVVALVQPTGDPHVLDDAASYDYLTGLPTRAALAQRLVLVERQSQDSGRFAVLFIDADGFKAVNDHSGHRAGDAVLQTLGRRLRACMRPGDFVARYGGDEFVALIDKVRSAREVARIAKRIRKELSLTIDAAGGTLCVSVSVGVAIGAAGASGQQVLDEADRAMYRAKHNSRA